MPAPKTTPNPDPERPGPSGPSPDSERPDAPEQDDAPTAVEMMVAAAIAAVADGTPTSAQRQIVRAHSLERQRSELLETIGKNRDYLRLMDTNDELSDTEGEWLDAFYPLKERGEQRSADEIERTRKARAAARGK